MLEAVFVLLFVINPLSIVAAVYVIKEIFMSDVQAAVDEITSQLGKVRDEVVSEIAKLEAAVVAGDPVDLSALKAAADALDAIVPDPVVDEELPSEEEAPVEE